jgi:general transcriptional corepressor CYC8
MNGPPGPQWGAPAPGSQQPSQGPPPAMGPPGDWNRRLADMQNPQMPPQQLPPYDQRDGVRPPPPHSRAPSPPRPDHLRQYPEPPRAGAAPPRRGLSPSPKTHNTTPHGYQGPQGMPPQPGPSPAMAQPQQPPTRITNPNYGTHSSNMPTPVQTPLSGPPSQGPIYGGRPASPAPEIRPIIENRPGSASGGQGHTYAPGNPYTNGIASGAPIPSSAMTAETIARERDEKTPNKRGWEEDNSMAKQSGTDDNKRPRLDGHASPSRRPSPPHRMPSDTQRTPPDAIEARRQAEEQQRRTAAAAQAEAYHPSEAAHHPQPLPSITHPPGSAGSNGAPPSSAPPAHPLGQGPQGAPPQSTSVPPMQSGPHPPPPEAPASGPPSASGPPEPTVKEEKKEVHEPAARKMDVDENYDDGSEDEKRPAARDEKSSPARPAMNGVAVSNGEVKA